MRTHALVAGYARTPFIKYGGVFASVDATVLGAHAIAAAPTQAGISAEEVDFVYGGQVVQAGAGQNPARQSARGAGIPLTTPAVTVNAVCLSGMLAVIHGARLIEEGAAHVVVAVGQESMSRAPHAWPGSRIGRRYGAVELLDTLESDGLSDAFEHIAMGELTDRFNESLAISRDEQDWWAAASHHRLGASAAYQSGEIEPFSIAGRRGAVTRVADDDGLRIDTSVEALARLTPAFGSGGTVTAGNSSQITDGAAAVVLVAEGYPLGSDPLAVVLSHATVAGPDTSLQAQPANAIRAAAEKIGVAVRTMRHIEINEAFGAVTAYSSRSLGVAPEIVNAHGGAIAMGHPTGASGTRIVGTLARRIHADPAAPYGAAGICGGGGQGSAVILKAF